MTGIIEMIILLLILPILVVKYLKGDFNYTDEIIHQGNLVDEKDRCTGSFFTIKRTYESGRIKIFTKNTK